MNVEKDPAVLREIGIKLANFRKKLALAIAEKKITQIEFGDMFGGHSSRKITSYERGEVDAPASLLYQIWQSGNSIDRLFNEEPITESGKIGAKKLYEECGLARLKTLDDAAAERAMKEAENAKQRKNSSTQETSPYTSGKRKERHRKKSSTKER